METILMEYGINISLSKAPVSEFGLKDMDEYKP